MSTFHKTRSVLLQRIQKKTSEDLLTDKMKASFLNFFQYQMKNHSIKRSILNENVDLIPENETQSLLFT